MNSCNTCHVHMDAQTKWGWRCPACIKAYKSDWAKSRRKKGLYKVWPENRSWRRKWTIEYRKRPGVRARLNELARKYSKDPKKRIKMRARSAVAEAIKSGRLIRKACSVCKEPKSQAHHPDYSKPLFVVWLCALCHGAEHPRRKQVEKGGE